SRPGEPPATRAVPQQKRSLLHRRDCCLGPDQGDPVPHCWQRWTSPFGVPGIGAGSEPKKPFRRCFKPRRPWRAGYAGFASGCRSREQGSSVSSLGGCPASCPDAHRPTHGHRHVRNWAISEISYSAALSSVLVLTKDDRRNFPRRRAKRSGKLLVRGCERLDAARGADELHHDDDAAQYEQPVENARAERAQNEQVGDRPATGKGGAE